MTERNQFPPADDDPVLDRQLLALKHIAPFPGFENRVLSRVWRPAPMFLLAWKDRLQGLFTSRVRWALAGLASFGSAASTAAVAWWVSTPGHLPAGSPAWGAGMASGFTWDTARDTLISWLPAAATYLTAFPAASYSRWAGAAVAVSLAPAISLAGLYLVMRRPAGERVRSHATR